VKDARHDRRVPRRSLDRRARADWQDRSPEEAEVDGYISKREGMEAIVKRAQELLGLEESTH
jgi:hypothetical protein